MRRNSNSLSRLSPPTREESDAIFKLLDVDGDGALDILELRRRSAAATLAKAGVHASVSTLAFFSTADGNLDKLLDAAEVRRRRLLAAAAAIAATAAATAAPPRCRSTVARFHHANNLRIPPDVVSSTLRS